MKKIPANTSFYTYYNANPLGKKTGDCVIRALSLTPGSTWFIVFDELCEIARDLACTPTDDAVWDAWLKKHGYVRYKQPRRENRRLYMLREFACSDLISDDDLVVVSVSGHLTCIKDRKILDTWNCAGYKVRRYYKLKV